MSFEQPLEEHEDPYPSAYDVMPDGKTRAYHVESIVNERNKKRGSIHSHQYLVRYKDGQHQWWKRSDVQSYLSVFLKQYNGKKSVNENTPTPGKLEKIHFKRRGDSSFQITTPPPPTKKNDKEWSLRFSTRSGSQNAKNNDPVSKSTVQIHRDTQGAVSMISGESNNGKSGHGAIKKQRLASKVSESVGTLISSQMNTGNDELQKGARNAENTEQLRKLLSVQNMVPYQVYNAETEQFRIQEDIDQYLKVHDDPRKTLEHMAEKVKNVANDFVGPVLKEREADKAEIEKLKLRNQEAEKQVEDLKRKLNEAAVEKVEMRQEYETKLENMGRDLSKAKEELETVLQGVTINQEIARQDKEENDKLLKEKDNLLEKKDVLLEERDKRITSLKTENESLTTQKLETLRKIVGEGNYKDTDDEAPLMKKAEDMIDLFHDFLNLQSRGRSLGSVGVEAVSNKE